MRSPHYPVYFWNFVCEKTPYNIIQQSLGVIISLFSYPQEVVPVQTKFYTHQRERACGVCSLRDNWQRLSTAISYFLFFLCNFCTPTVLITFRSQTHTHKRAHACTRIHAKTWAKFVYVLLNGLKGGWSGLRGNGGNCVQKYYNVVLGT